MESIESDGARDTDHMHNTTDVPNPPHGPYGFSERACRSIGPSISSNIVPCFFAHLLRGASCHHILHHPTRDQNIAGACKELGSSSHTFSSALHLVSKCSRKVNLKHSTLLSYFDENCEAFATITRPISWSPTREQHCMGWNRAALGEWCHSAVPCE